MVIFFCKFKMSEELLCPSPLVSTNLVITLSMKFLFYKFKKYPDGFSPNSSYLHLDLNMTPSVLTFLISDSAFFLSSIQFMSSSVIYFKLFVIFASIFSISFSSCFPSSDCFFS